MTLPRLAIPLALVLGGLAGCGGSGAGQESTSQRQAEKSPESDSGKAPAFACVDEARKVALPAGFPTSFPLPDGSVVLGSERRSEGRVIVYAVSPSDVKATLAAMQQIPDAGFELTAGEVEEHDAESNWRGDGYAGRWSIRQMPDCTGQTSVTVLAQKQ